MNRFFLVFISLIMAVNSLAIEVRLIKKFYGASAPKSVEVSPDGKYAAVMNLEGLNFWLINTKTLKKDRIVYFFRTSATGWDYKHHRPISSYAEKPVECAFSKDSRYLWVSLHNAAAVVRYDMLESDTKKTRLMQKIRVKYPNSKRKSIVYYIPKIRVGKTPKIIAITPNGKYVLVANWHSSSISVIDTISLKRIKDIHVGGRWRYIPRGIAVDSLSQKAYIANMGGGTISIISLDKMKVVKDLPITRNPRHIVISKDNNILYISDNAAGAVLKYDISSKKVIARKYLGRKARTIAITPDERYLFVALHGSDKVDIVSSKDLRLIKEISFARPMGVSISPNGRQLWITSYQGSFVAVYKINY